MRKAFMIAGAAVMVAGAGIVGVPLMAFIAVAGGGGSGAATGGFGTGLKAGTVPAQYVTLVEQAGSMCAEAPPSIIAAQIEQESAWNPDAISSAGAQGISQFMPGTWPTWSQPGQSPFDPTAAIPAQGKYDCALAAQMQDAVNHATLPTTIDITSLMLAAYNAGPAAVLAAHGIPDNGQTPGYVTTITARAAYFSDTTGLVADGPFAQKLIDIATAQIGTPYAWDGGSYTGPTKGVCGSGPAANDCNITGFDCSGLVLYAAYQASGGQLKLAHSADVQSRGGTPVQRADMQPGDLIGFTDPGATEAHHIAIYLGNNQIVNAPDSGGLVRIDSLTTAYYQGQGWRIARYG